jgi:uncharacterized protein (DUF1697 family)
MDPTPVQSLNSRPPSPVRVTKYVGLLRGVNVGPNRRIQMARLRAVAADLGLEGVGTFLNSGNLYFRCSTRTRSALEQRLEQAVETELGVPAEVLVRTAEEWDRAIRANPFPAEAAADPAHLLVWFLRRAPSSDAVAALRRAVRGPERSRIVDDRAYVVYPDGIAGSTVNARLIERHLGQVGTGRNWTTVLQLDKLVQALPPH